MCEKMQNTGTDTPGNGSRKLPPPNYLWLSVMFLLCCCSPMSIVAIYYGIKTNRVYMRGDDDAAQQASCRALLWCWMSAAWAVFMTFWTMFFCQKIQFLIQSWQ